MVDSLKRHPGLGLAVALALVVAAMLGLAHGAQVAVAAEAGAGDCLLRQAPLDEGYGLSRIGWRAVCPR